MALLDKRMDHGMSFGKFYKAYLKEREKTEVYETKHGFATYRHEADNITYLIDIYVEPSKRDQNQAQFILDKVINRAKLRGSTRLIGSVVPSTSGATNMIKMMMAYDFKLWASEKDMIYLFREI